MIVGINLNTLGDRYIAALYFIDSNSRKDKESIAKLWTNHYDEVYIVDSFDNCNDNFISEIVLKSCRIS